MTGTNLHKRCVVLLSIFTLIFLLNFSIVLARNRDNLDNGLADCLALLKKHPEAEIADKLLHFLSLQGDYVAQKFFTTDLEQILIKHPDNVTPSATIKNNLLIIDSLFY